MSSPAPVDFSAVDEVWAQRRGARSRLELAYLVYLAVMTIGVLGLPVARVAAQALARPDVLVLLRAEQAATVGVLIAGLTAAAAVGLGAVRGPAVLSTFFTATLASGPRPRRTALLRPFLRALLMPVGLLLCAAALPAMTLRTVGEATAGDVAWFLVASTGMALLVHASWLLGQLLGPWARRALVLGLLLCAGGSLLLPTGLSPSVVWPASGADAAAWACGLLAAGLASVLVCIPLLDRLPGRVLAEQASRWETASTIATSGDLTGAGGVFRALPSTGRRLPVVGARPLAWLYLRRDALAWLRTPERTVLAVAGAAAGSVGLLSPDLIAGPVGWSLAATGAVVLWAASGALTDGIRHAVATLGAPALFGQGARTQILLHIPAPALGLGAVAEGAAAAVVLAQPTTPSVLPLALLPVIVLSLVLARVWAAAKGPMPLKLATPMPTAQGDASVLPQLLWHSDWVWVVLLVTLFPLGVLHGAGPGTALLVGGALLTVVALMAEARLLRLRR